VRFSSAILVLSTSLGVLTSREICVAQGSAAVTPSTATADDAPPTPSPAAPPPSAGFAFGSYGRVRAASDLRGHTGQSTNIVSFGTRFDLGNYAELELRREDHPGELQLRIVSTLGFQGDFFHYTSTFNDQVGIRNLYAEVAGALDDRVSLWAGSRMVRGDDVYLLNFWPLDNLNLIGGGGAFTTDHWELKLHGGLTRPNDPFYTQQDSAVANQGFLPQSVTLLDRPRSIIAARAAFWPLGSHAKRGVKVIGYAEAHHLPDGERETAPDSGEFKHLPAMSGYVVGVQLGAYLDEPQAFTNLFARCARGIAAYDPLQTFGAIAPVPGTTASDCRVALSANVELGAVAVQLGAYLREFRDPSATATTGGKLEEGIVDVRPYVWIGQRAGFSVDASYQALRTLAVNPDTGRLVGGAISKLAVIPFYSPYGRGTYTRPQLQVIYALSRRNADARRLYPDLDRRSSSSVEQFFAIGAEWWFNSTSY